jgi:hypothetical protein
MKPNGRFMRLERYHEALAKKVGEAIRAHDMAGGRKLGIDGLAMEIDYPDMVARSLYGGRLEIGVPVLAKVARLLNVPVDSLLPPTSMLDDDSEAAEKALELWK